MDKQMHIDGYASRLGSLAVCLFAVTFPAAAQDNAGSVGVIGTDSGPAPSSVWQAGPGEGFNKGARELSLTAGVGLGMQMFGSSGRHDWVIGALDCGWMLTDTLGQGCWYKGNVEFVAEVFGGNQYWPDHAYFVGGGPQIRYNFAVGHRLVPYVEYGMGLTSTAIRDGDLSTPFEFNLQVGGGVHYLLTDQIALTAEYRLIHLSNAGIKDPNQGVNTSNFMGGLTWFF